MNEDLYKCITYHKPIILNNITFHNLPILFKQWFDVSSCSFVSQIANEDFKCAHTTEARHDAITHTPNSKSKPWWEQSKIVIQNKYINATNNYCYCSCTKTIFTQPFFLCTRHIFVLFYSITYNSGKDYLHETHTFLPA